MGKNLPANNAQCGIGNGQYLDLKLNAVTLTLNDFAYGVIRLSSWTQAMGFGPILEPVLCAKRRQVSFTRRRVQNQVLFGLTEPYHYGLAGFAKRVWETANHYRPLLLVSHILE